LRDTRTPLPGCSRRFIDSPRLTHNARYRFHRADAR
jgi:hypothetical protein